MNRFILDASALVKRYVPEAGAPLLDYLFDRADVARLTCLTIGALEALSVIVRARNGGRISADVADRGVAGLHWEVLLGPTHAVHPDEDAVLAAAPLIETHNINSTDAVLLRVALDARATMRLAGDDLVLLTSDRRLVRAAKQKGLVVFDPEAEDLPALELLVGSA